MLTKLFGCSKYFARACSLELSRYHGVGDSDLRPAEGATALTGT